MKSSSPLLLSLLAFGFGIPLSHAAPPAAGTPKTGDYKGITNKETIPGNAWGVFSIADAQKEAVKKKRALTFLITYEQPNEDAAVKKATAKAFWALEDDSIVVVLRYSSAGDWSRLPELVQKTAKSPGLGKEFPKLFVTTDDASLVLASMDSTKVMNTSAKDFNKFGKEVKKIASTKTVSTDFPPPSTEEVKPAMPAAADKTTPPASTPAAPATPAVAAGPVTIKEPKVENWTNSEGRAIQAALAEVNGDDITFIMNGKKIPYSITKLSPESQKHVEDLKAAASK